MKLKRIWFLGHIANNRIYIFLFAKFLFNGKLITVVTSSVIKLFLYKCLTSRDKKNSKQECIPVGCIPPASVVTTRCQYRRGVHYSGCTFWGDVYQGPGTRHTYPPQKGSGTGHTTRLDRITDTCENITFPQLR